MAEQDPAVPPPALTWAASREPSHAEWSLVAAEVEPHPADERPGRSASGLCPRRAHASRAAHNAFLPLTTALGGDTGVRLVRITPTGCVGKTSQTPTHAAEMRTEAPSPLPPPGGGQESKSKSERQVGSERNRLKPWAAGRRPPGIAQGQYPPGLRAQLDAPGKEHFSIP